MTSRSRKANPAVLPHPIRSAALGVLAISLYFGYCLLTSFYTVNPAHANVLLSQNNVILNEDFELGTIDPRISIQTVGSFSSGPGVKNAPNFGSAKAFGFGLSTCGFNCFLSRVTTLRITLPTATLISSISFKEMELFSNWGSQGKVFVDGVLLSNSDFGKIANDFQPDTTFRSRSFTINRSATTIDLRVEDITNLSEIYIDDLVITGTAPITFQITSVLPNKGGNTGTVTTTIRGSGFQPGAIVRLREGTQVVVTGQNTIVTLQTRIQTSFDLRGQATKALTLEILNPDGASTTLSQGFTIEEGRAAQVWVDIIGPDVYRPGRPTTFTLVYGNKGNVDSGRGLLWVTGIPPNAQTTAALGEPAGPVPDPLAQPEAPQPVILERDGRKFLHVGFSSLAPNATYAFPITLNIPTADTHELQAYGWAAPRSDKQTSTQECTSVNCMPSQDRDALNKAVSIAFRVWRWIFQQDLCVGASIDLASQLKQEASRAGSPLSGWTIQIINGCFDSEGVGFHNSVRLKSPNTGQDYYLHSYFWPRLCRLTEERNERGEIIGWTAQGCGYDCLYRPDPIPWCSLPKEERRRLIRGVVAIDPNEKVGSQGSGERKYITGAEPFRYSVRFENLPVATAPAQDVVITDQLDTTKLDLNTFSLGPISFGKWWVTPPPGLSSYSTTVDLRPANNLLVRVDATLNKTTGLIRWSFTSLDPKTNLPPEDPLAGFLPPNRVPPEGDGSVLFTVMPKQDLSTGTEILNQAQIIFDLNASIDTPAWFNTLDNTKPTSQVLPLAATQCSSFQLQWSGDDAGAGIQNYTIFVSDNGGPYVPFLSNTTSTSALFSGQVGRSYRFYSVASDKVGNLEDVPATPDATITIDRSIALSSTSQSFSKSGGSGSVGVTAESGCSWIAVSNASFITITSSSGINTGNGTVTYLVAPHSGTDSRTGTLTIAGQTFTVTQDAVADNVPPTITCPTAQSAVTNNGPVAINYPAPTANDNLPGVRVACVPPAGANFPLGTTTVNCTASDAAGNTAACSFAVTVRQPRPACKDLINRVKALVPPLTQAQANGLIGQLEMANTNLERGQMAQACTHLQNFVTQVNAFVSGGQLTAAQGQALLSYANKIRNAVGCAGSPFPL